MFRRKQNIDAAGPEPGVSAGSVLTGVVVAFGSMVLFGVMAAAIGMAGGVTESDIRSTDANLGIGIFSAIVVIQFLSYMWGGYTAGRMGRAAGPLNGFLVPAVALLIGGVLALTSVTIGSVTSSSIPFPSELPFGGSDIAQFGTVLGLASLAAMFLGGLAGGTLGARWHQKVDHFVTDTNHRTIDLRDDTRTTVGK